MDGRHVSAVVRPGEQTDLRLGDLVLERALHRTRPHVDVADMTVVTQRGDRASIGGEPGRADLAGFQVPHRRWRLREVHEYDPEGVGLPSMERDRDADRGDVPAVGADVGGLGHEPGHVVHRRDT